MPGPDREWLTAEVARLNRALVDAHVRIGKEHDALAAANARADGCNKHVDMLEESLAAARRECEGLRRDIAALLPMAERAHRREPCFTLGAPDMGLVENLRVAREGALLMRLRHDDAALAAPAAGEEE